MSKTQSGRGRVKDEVSLKGFWSEFGSKSIKSGRAWDALTNCISRIACLIRVTRWVLSYQSCSNLRIACLLSGKKSGFCSEGWVGGEAVHKFEDWKSLIWLKLIAATCAIIVHTYLIQSCA